MAFALKSAQFSFERAEVVAISSNGGYRVVESTDTTPALSSNSVSDQPQLDDGAIVIVLAGAIVKSNTTGVTLGPLGCVLAGTVDGGASANATLTLAAHATLQIQVDPPLAAGDPPVTVGLAARAIRDLSLNWTLQPEMTAAFIVPAGETYMIALVGSDRHQVSVPADAHDAGVIVLRRPAV